MKDLDDRPRFKNTIHLWEFLMELLNNQRYSSIIEWTRREHGEFKLIKQEEVARQWGLLKQRKGMTYDKLSRSLRYYYDKKIISKVSGQKLVYKFRNLPFEYLPLRNLDQTTRRKQLQGHISSSFSTKAKQPTPQPSPPLQEPQHPVSFEPPRPSVIRSLSNNNTASYSCPKPFYTSSPMVMSRSQIIFPACNCMITGPPFVKC